MLKNVSLTNKMLILILLVGSATWAVLDGIQTRSIGRIFNDQLAKELAIQAQEDRLEFDHFVKTHSEAARLLTAQKRFNDYLDSVDASGWNPAVGQPRTYTGRPPMWYPRLSVARAFMNARYALLLGPDGRVVEVFQVGEAPPPAGLMNPTALLRELSHNQSYMTIVGGTPFLIAADSVKGPGGGVRVTVLLATPLDDETLFEIYGLVQHERITALLDQDGTAVIASSRPDLIPDGTTIETLSGKYLIAGKSFFDYGSSDLRLQFSSFISSDEVEELTGTVLEKERYQRAITALALVVSFIFIMLWITGNIKLLKTQVSDFSSNVLGIKHHSEAKGDQLLALKDEFEMLTEEVISARAALQREAEEKLLLERQAALAKLKERDIEILMQVMEILGVGVIGLGEGDPTAINPVMLNFAEDCGGLSNFLLEEGLDRKELYLSDCHGEARYFALSRFFSPGGDEGYLLVHDLTEERRAEDTLRESEGRARAITETATDAIILIDESGRVTYWNPAAVKIFGYTLEEAMGKDVHELLTPDKHIAAAREGFDLFARSGEGPVLGVTRVLSAKKKDGTEFPVELSLSAFDTKGGRIAVGIVRDITDRVKAEQDKDAMFHMMTHDIKGPLSIIYGYGELLNIQLREQPDLDMVADIQKAAHRISSLIDDMLALSRMESGKTALNIEDVAVRELVDLAVEDSRISAQEMEVSIETDIPEGMPLAAMDRKQMGRAVENLVLNAVNYNRHGGRVLVRAGIADGNGASGGRVYIEVSDTGMGIDPEDLPHVFDKYYRSKKTGTRKGTGLGLAIVKAAVEAHGGGVSVESTEDRGTTFRVELPARQQQARSQQDDTQDA